MSIVEFDIFSFMISLIIFMRILMFMFHYTHLVFSKSVDFMVPMTIDDMVINHPGCLHMGIANC